MFKKWLAQFVALCLCIITILSSITPVFADTYVKSESGSDATYFIVEGKDVNKLFDFGIWDVDDLASWMFQFKTFTVIKKYDAGNGTQYKMYFNTPNLQSILKNRVTSLVSDGYTDSTYKVEDTEWVIKVGKNASTENVVTKYGFNIPSYTYMGEYPKEVMTTSGILPSSKKGLEAAWRAIKSIFGVSFIAAPNADNYNTILYLNHTYTDRNDYILSFFKNYYLDYFERQIPLKHIDANDADKAGQYFSGPEEVIELAVTEDAYKAAVKYNNVHSDEYTEACQRKDYWDAYQKGGIDACLALDTQVGNKQYDSYHFLASIEKYNNIFDEWAKTHPENAYILLNGALGASPKNRRFGGSGGYLSKASKYGLTPSTYTENTHYDTSTSLAADILKYTADSSEFKAKIYYDTYERTTTKTVISNSSHTKNKKTTKTKNKTGSSSSEGWHKVGETVTEVVPFSDTVAWRDVEKPLDYFDNYSKTSSSSSKQCNDKDKPLDKDYNTWTETTTTTTETKRTNYHIEFLFSKNDTTHTMSYNDYKQFRSACGFENISFAKDDFLPALIQTVYDTYTANVELQEKYKKFCAMLERGDDQTDPTSKKELLYRQCLITNEGKDNECWSRKYGEDKSSLSLVQVYAFSRVYQVTADYTDDVHVLTDADAHEILNRLQKYCGPYYPEVLSNIMKIMSATAKFEGNKEPTNYIITDDARVMPYDTATLTPKDKVNYNITDPRVELYKTHLIGELISNIRLNPLGLSVYFKPQKTIISIAGRITEASVFFQEICNFEMLDNFGLSPATMWNNGNVTLLMALLAVFFIVQTVVSLVKMGTRSAAKSMLAFVILVLELGFITSIAYNPQKAWNTVKKVDSFVINLGEVATVHNYQDLSYLFKSATDSEIVYYLPYLDIWSKYNTGYGILDKEQQINKSRDKLELVDVSLPTINGTEVKQWSIVLMDAFSYSGHSNSVVNTITENGKTYNGSVINNNAYRVIDHFMAPRVKLTDNGDTISMTITQNKNYNGQLQSGMLDLVVKLLNCILMSLLSMIKLLTFLWQWFVFYIFIYRVILGKGAEGKSMGDILIETFSPAMSLFFIGLYSGMIMNVGMNASGLVGIVLELALFWLTFMLIRWWYNLANQKFFPKSLTWLYYATNLSFAKRQLNRDRIQNQAKNDDIENDMPEDYSYKTLEEQRAILFDENGNIRDKYKDEKYHKQIGNWYNRATALQGPGYNVQHSAATLRQMEIIKNSDYFDDLTLLSKGDSNSAKKFNKYESETQYDPNADLAKKDYTYKTKLHTKRSNQESPEASGDKVKSNKKVPIIPRRKKPEEDIRPSSNVDNTPVNEDITTSTTKYQQQKKIGQDDDN